MRSFPTVSVIIPTYNRSQWLRETLDALAQQHWPTAVRFEVIVVDDGSTDETSQVASENYFFPLRYIWQTNQGDAAARNTGAQQSQADILVFLDDDILIEPNYLLHLVRAHDSASNRIVVGTSHLWLEKRNPLSYAIPPATDKDVQSDIVEIEFAVVCSNNMSIRRDAYLAVGMMENLGFTSSSIWCDVDFTYRAYRQGFQFYRSIQAVCWHRDYVFQSLDNQKKRMWQAAYRAVRLFQLHPELPPYLPMFSDKTPVALGHDSPKIVLRKLARQVSSSRPALWFLERAANFFDKYQLSPALRDRLRLWVVGGYIFQGYRHGLRNLEPQQRQVMTDERFRYYPKAK